MERLESMLSVLERALNTKRKKHIAGGILTSVSLLFGTLAVTVISLRVENKEPEKKEVFVVEKEY